MPIKQTITTLSEDTKANVAVATATAGTGMMTMINLIPNDIGKLASFAGLLLTVTLLLKHWFSIAHKAYTSIKKIKASRAKKKRRRN